MTTTAKQLGWVPIYGEFDLSGDTIVFNGKRITVPARAEPAESETVERASLGLLLSSSSIVDGELSAEVEFDSLTPESACEIAVSYSNNPQHLVTAGIGGQAMFAIREFGGPATGSNQQPYWYYHWSGGERSGLKPKKKYRLDVKFRGSLIDLSIDGVEVSTVSVSFPQGRRRQVGILCQSESRVTIRRFNVNAEQPTAFVVMQFDGAYDDIYKDVVQEVATEYKVFNAAEFYGPGLIIADIVQSIAAAQLVIADITPPNPNVYFEVGYALALNKPIILLAKKGTNLPFDVAAFRVQFYEDTIGGKRRLEEGLKRHLEAIRA
jgi:hypothetical protein